MEEKLQSLLSLPQILYEDEFYLFIDKPAGMVCHPAKAHYGDSLTYLLEKAYWKKKEDPVRILGRLDKDTSGIVSIAKTLEAAKCWEKTDSQKTYYALVHGVPNPEKGTICLPMAQYIDFLDHNKRKSCQKPDGRNAVTNYMTEKSYDSFSLCRITLETGRMHQIRFHMSELGYPLLGDPVYGRNDGYARTMLHAGELQFLHPFTKNVVKLQSNFPKDFLEILETSTAIGVGRQINLPRNLGMGGLS